ncbi:MAG: hypothetical protein PHX74_07905 [Candidatus Sumerlaeales bacterium]|nr:hypothetical protein [Candidatus Sumerlaeales bacterium]
MPRYFGNETYNGDQGVVKWYNGACAVDEDDAAAIAFLDAIHGIDKDTNKHELTTLDKLPRDVLDDVASYLGVALVDGDGKYDVVRDIETSISTKYITALTVTSVAHNDTVGNTVLTVTANGVGGATNEYYYKADATSAPAPLYGDKIDSTWTLMTSGAAAGVKLTTGEFVTVVEAKKSTGFIFAAGNDTIASKGAE